jgi:hypothetical protein
MGGVTVTSFPRPGRAALLIGVLAVAALPWLARALGGPALPRCVSDGVPLAADAPRVRLEWADGTTRDFCCVSCAEGWALTARSAPADVRVTDEPSGRLIEARKAYFVASHVVAQPATRDSVHSFADEAEARRHADAYRGSLLTGSDRPFGAAR